MRDRRRTLFLFGSVAATFLSDTTTTHAYYTNVYGDELRSCSSDGTALTGFTRTGYCVDRNDDAGSHHICIDLSSSTTRGGGNFCDVTGQSDWCDQEAPCHDDADQNCPIWNWCVCQWAFASYLENAGGCDYVQDVVCDAINMEAVEAYRRQSQSKYANALRCIEERCNIQAGRFSLGDALLPSHAFPLTVLLLSALTVAILGLKKWNGTHTHSESDTTDYVSYQAA
uniref:Uncharacterized protein n=1 Tax=Odontella aurita TaxID=265563 RepID=A0A7S4K584_9STRA|mmetsp:Transcript_62054/g.183352  ORF Transcript_62054/g.183352 Transcript_62054/m.183352 type:complete len:227 (+) Transcript_62054:64-744(+)